MTGTEIRELRQSYGESQEVFAARLGVTGKTVHRWEKGTVPLPAFRAKLARLARAKGNGERE